MAQPEPRRWSAAALGGLLLALGGALLRARLGKAPPSPARRAKPSRRGGTRKGAAKTSGPANAQPRAGTRRAKVRTKPKVVEPPARSLHWPPPPPLPIAPTGDGMQAEEGARATPLPVDARSETLGYEVADARAATLVKIMAFGVAAIVASVAGLFLLVGQSHRADRASTPLTPQQLAVIVPPGPRLQEHPLHDIATERKREEDLLTSYAWTDRTRGAARIPLARASALVIGRPLDPLPPAGPAPADPPPAAARP